MAGEKRSQDQDETLLARTVLVDIEGTTTSISFVKETLFPYVRQNLKNYIEAKWEDEEFKQDYEKLKEQAKKDEEAKLDGFVAIAGDKLEEEKDSLFKNISWQMDNDRKTGALKQLQGHMWREAYETGAVKAHVYEDVPKAFELWTNDARKIYVYSSGSVEAQKLLFGHSTHGDLLKYFSGFFDTEVGAKQECDSYKNILSKIDEKPSNVVFLTDVVKEAAAAKEAGISTVIVEREGNAALTDEEKLTYSTIKSFLDLSFQTSTKRQKIEKTDEKVDEGTTGDSEPMDTSEDVEMADVGDKKVEKDDAKEATKSEEAECAKKQPSENASTSAVQKEEPMAIEKDSSKSEQETSVAATVESNDAKSKDKIEDTDSVESAKQAAKDGAATLAKKDSDKVAAEKTEEKLDVVAKEVTPDNSMDVSVPETVSKSENSTSSEKKTEDSTDVAKDSQAEAVDKTQKVESNEKMEDEPESQPSDKNDKPEESLKAEKEEVKEESKISGTSESKDISAKSEQEEVTKMETNVAENGETAEPAVEKTVPPKVTDTEATTSTTEVKKEATVEELAEKHTETVAESEKVDEKASQGVKAEEVAATDAEKESTKQDATKEEEAAAAAAATATAAAVKEETVVDAKDKNTVDSEKLNGTTQNGDADVPVLDDKLHSNGLNEGPSKETTSEEAAAQNGEPESSSENSAESIKVKKVVDSTVADGAGEPDVVPPVVVAATS